MLYTIVVISLCALALKILTLFRLGALLKGAPLQVIIPIFCFFGMNLTELIAFKLASMPDSWATATFGYPLLIQYYVLIITAIYGLLFLALENTSVPKRWWLPALATFFAVTQVTVLIPGVGIAGVEHIGYTGTRIAGPYYFIFQIGIFIPTILIPSISMWSLKSASNHHRKQVAYLHTWCFLPIVMAVLVVFMLMLAGFKVNASAILSLAVCVPVWLLLYSSTKKELRNILYFLPFTSEHKMARNLFSSISNGDIKAAVAEVEQMILRGAIAETDGNKTHAAKLIGMSRTSMLRKINGYGLDNEDGIAN